MKAWKYNIPDRYIIGTLAAGSLFLGASIGAVYTSYKNLKLQQAGIEFRIGNVEKRPTSEGMPEHNFPTVGVFLGGKNTPYITYIYESKEKMEKREAARTFISTMDNGINDVRITSEKKCQRCHLGIQVIPRPNEYKDRISM